MSSYQDYCTERHLEWCKLIPGYRVMSKTQKRKAKLELKMQGTYPNAVNAYMGYCTQLATTGYAMNNFSLADNPAPTPCPPTATTKRAKKEEETMSTSYINISNDQKQSDEMTKTEYLLGRIRNAYYAKSSELRTFFKLDDDDAPTSPKELVERIQAGAFELPKPRFEDSDDRDEDFYDYCNPIRNIRWRSGPADRAGYEAADKKLKDALQAGKDTIMIGTPAEGLATLQAFESATFH